ncbi:hypothetical protein FNF28_05890 [Cafeteria roenbergensis]|uniref:Uncharacterized protein n=1 Tax=Cafeteria roenbergensis TaxID=33653 RepID=A0A5A8D1K5_CAFRO|nr:hypothetical protein FNF28_05890 [Cafeteria roenbergensis]
MASTSPAPAVKPLTTSPETSPGQPAKRPRDPADAEQETAAQADSPAAAPDAPADGPASPVRTASPAASGSAARGGSPDSADPGPEMKRPKAPAGDSVVQALPRAKPPASAAERRGRPAVSVAADDYDDRRCAATGAVEPEAGAREAYRRRREPDHSPTDACPAPSPAEPFEQDAENRARIESRSKEPSPKNWASSQATMPPGTTSSSSSESTTSTCSPRSSSPSRLTTAPGGERVSMRLLATVSFLTPSSVVNAPDCLAARTARSISLVFPLYIGPMNT